MPLREFLDSDGTFWTVWTTVPGWQGGVASELHAGWLTFESVKGRRRLAPVPAKWEEASEGELCAYCSQAEVVRRGRPSVKALKDP